MWENLKVPLLALWGAISYVPAMVRRRIGSKQFIPMTHELDRRVFYYSDEEILIQLKERASAWKQVHRRTPEKFIGGVTDEYPAWHARRRKGFLAPKVYGPDLPMPMKDSVEDSGRKQKSGMS
jgi:hypothetical protein